MGGAGGGFLFGGGGGCRRGVGWEPVLEEALPEVVWWCGEEGVEREGDDGRWVEG